MRYLFLAALLFVQTLVPAVAETVLGHTFFQTNVSFDPRIALDVDFIVVHQHGSPGIGDAMRTWKENGYPAGRMFFIGSDAGRIYTTGQFDGEEHLDETEVDREGNVIECAGVRPYMIPTDGWTEYVNQLIEEGVAADAVAILPEEPLAHTHGGYGEAFQEIWAERYGAPWVEPHSSPNAFFKSSRLLSDLYFELVEKSIETTQTASAERGIKPAFLLPIHPLLSHAAGRMTYPSGRSIALGEKGMTGFVGQVWTGPIAWGMSEAEGKPMDRNADFFENAYLMYSYFAHLVKSSSVRCYLLADPVEDDPQYSWEDYRKWYNQCLVALLQFPWMHDFEVMPWPDRVFLPGYHMASGTPGPEDYRRALMIAFSALSYVAETPNGEVPTNGNERLGFLVSDTLSWQRGGPEGSSMGSVHGFTIPLLRRGIPIQIVPLERHADSAFFDEFDTLVLSYDAQKPLDPSMNDSLAAWVKRGGRLIYLGGADTYNDIESWWKEGGFEAPQDHLWEQLGIWKRGDGKVVLTGDKAEGSKWEDEPVKLEEGNSLVGYAFKDAAPMLRAFLASAPPDVWYLSRTKVGEGKLVFCGLPSRWFAESESGGAMALRILAESDMFETKTAIAEADHFTVRRGRLVATRACRHPQHIEGVYLDLLSPNLDLVRDPHLESKAVGLYFDVKDKLQPKASGSRLLFAGPRAEVIEESPGKILFKTKSPDGTPATVRLANRGSNLGEIIPLHPDGSVVDGTVVEEDEESDTVLLVIPAGVAGAEVELNWTP